ncbi:MAG: NifU family protein [Pseudomonadota bacterium]|nr:NifU family protein [Pseudomonadota bacterium]|tara:strand:- start:836 stop:1381 length:546 start_codon:yes stop_codon:yes gene_type:complete
MIQTQSTPNPNSLKFLSEKTISSIGTEEFQKDKSKSLSNSFVKELLEFKGVELVLLSKNFLSVKKNENVSWSELKPMIISHLNHYFENNDEPILKEKKQSISSEENDETVKKIKDVLDTKIRPAVARDGGDIKFKSFENGVVKVELQGSCSGCPSSLMTLKQGVQNLLKHYVKEVNSVEAS